MCPSIILALAADYAHHKHCRNLTEVAENVTFEEELLSFS
jgi:hypothetical protein